MTKAWPSPITQTLPDQVAQAILQRIATGEILPGHRLPSQRDLAQSMGVGLAVIREAVQRLQALNIVEASHGSGTVVRPFRWIPLIYDPSLFLLAVQRIGVRDLWEARRLIESQIIRLAAERATDANLAAMRDVLERAEPLPETYEASQVLNREFHLALARAAQNAVLEDLVAPLLDVQVEGIDHHFTRKQSRRTWAAHRGIYEAVAAHDVKAAGRVIERHFTIGPMALEAESEATLTTGPHRRASGRRPVRGASVVNASD